MRLSELPADQPELADLRGAATALITDFDAAPDADAKVSVMRRWDAWKAEYEAAMFLASIRFSQDTTDASRKALKQHFDRVDPDVKELDTKLLRRVVESPERALLEERLGSQALALWRCTLDSFDPAIADELRAESDLVNRYDELRASLRVDFRGESHGLSSMRGFYGDADRSTRHAARKAQNQLLSGAVDELDSLFAELVAVRHRMARKLGEATYTPLGYRMLGRTDYDGGDVAAFRGAIEARIVPLCTAIRARHAEQLGLDDYAFHDTSVSDTLGVPRPNGDHDWMLAQATTMFERMGADFSAFFEQMKAGELLDLKVRDGKMGGGYCEALIHYGLPFIFANFNGTQDDVNVFTHECGHAFQCWTTMQRNVLRDYVWPTYEACEIHSMGLEMLTYPHMELFFGDDAERFRRGHVEGGLLFLPYGAAVDAFQHEVYDDPTQTPDQRNATWSDLESRLLPEWRYDGLPHFESGRFWQRQGHLYSNPFYYIDYCLAQTCAFQLWRNSRRDHAGTMSQYRHLCRLGGELPFRALVAEVGLKDPFDPDTLAEVADDLAEQLDL
ncbi:MAG TPA: M3 family oligoendopeptidase [Myxococcota bacterium]|nr:M3 family oligoendopeptidase [Myxococcota bacterium]